MTIGQRIAQKRKELGFSQEALGEQLGVSRQSIYKWEADSALPEIDKLIALSRLFDVSVGWLLGVEDAPAEPGGASGGAEGELTEQQLRMVEEIVRQYSGGRGPHTPRRKKILKLAAAAGAVCLVGVLYSLSAQLGHLNRQYDSLQSSVYGVESSVDRQIRSISDRMEKLLEDQNDLVADSGTALELVSLRDGDAGVAVFSAYAVPRIYQEGMTAEFSIENGSGGTQSVPVVLGVDRKTFRTDSISCHLTDRIRLSVTFISPDGTRSTQLLDQYRGLYSETLPAVDIISHSNSEMLGLPANSSGLLSLPEAYVSVAVSSPRSTVDGAPLPRAGAETVQVGLFKNKALIAWLEPCEPPEDFHEAIDRQFYCLSEGTRVTMANHSTDQLCFAAVVTDAYGRQLVHQDIPYLLQDGALAWPSSFDARSDPADWQYDA